MDMGRIKILAIDDNQDNLISLNALIKETFPDAKVITSLNGKEGIKHAAAEDPDLILLDIVMPGMDGFEVCEKLKADKTLNHIPVVFITALKGDKKSRIHALEIGAEGFLAKPIDESELTAQIRAMVKIKAANTKIINEKERLAALVENKTLELQQAHQKTLQLLEELNNENEARKISEKKLEFYTANSPIAVIEWDSNFRITRWEGYSEKIFGWKSEEVIGKSTMDLNMIYEPDIPMVEKIINKLTTSKSAHVISSNRNYKKDGSIIFCEWYNTILKDKNGTMLSALSQVLDATKRKKAEEELKTHHAHLEEMVKKRTTELEEKNKKLESFNKLFIGRELRIKELKDKLKNLETTLQNKN